MKIYIAGPMTGLPDYNRPAFHQAARELRAAGHEVFNPAEQPEPADPTWENWMKGALALFLQAEAILLLPGWPTSRGARIEEQLARALSMQVHHEPPR